MHETETEPKNNQQSNDSSNQNGRPKRANTQQSLNTVNNTNGFIKKMTAKKENPQQKRQPKITAFMNLSNSTSFGSHTYDNTQFVNTNDLRIKDLQQRMRQRDLQIQNLKRTQYAEQAKFSKLYIENKQFKKKARQALVKSLQQAAQAKRAQKRQINPLYGFFKDGSKTFIDGPLITNLRQKIQERQKMIKSLQDQKKSKDLEKKQRAIYRIQFLQKQINGFQKQIDQLETTIAVYKQQLRAADKEMNCQLAKKKWDIIFDDYVPLELLGKGGFGQVYKCFDLQNHKTVALKINVFQGDAHHIEELHKHVSRQANALQSFSHPNIAKFFKLIQTNDNRIVFSMEYCSGPELAYYIRKNQCLQEKEAKQITRQILAALNYLSTLKEKIIHYDLKPSNILFNHGVVKILDFGLCKPISSEQSRIPLTSQGVGTYWYLPPQTFLDDCPQITPKVDVWSAGVIFFEMLYGKRPFAHGVSQEKIYSQGLMLNAKKVEFPTETPRKYKVSEATKNFIRQLLAYRVQDRLSANQAYEHEYFKR